MTLPNESETKNKREVMNSKKSAMQIGVSKKLDKLDLTCTICRSIFVEPVLLPCGHGFCLRCFNGIVEFNPLTCPCCRKRFSAWLRKANVENSLVNQSLWSLIQQNCNDENLQPLPDTTTTQRAEAVTAENYNLVRQISQPGEIRKEYEAQLQIFRKELEAEKQNELKASTEFIVKLLKEESESTHIESSTPDTPPTTPCTLSAPNETMLVATPGHTPYALNTKKTNCSSSSDAKRNVVGPSAATTAATASSAHVVGSVLSQSVASSSNLIKSLAVRLNSGTEILRQSVQKAIISKIPQSFLSTTINKEVLTVPPTNTHRAPSRNSNSADSLKLEMCHFKPIRTVPTTPTKRANAEIIRSPKAKRAALKLNSRNNCDKKSPDPQTSSLYQTLLQTPRKSAFYSVRTPPKNSSLQSSATTTSLAKIRSNCIQSHRNDIQKISKRLKSEVIRSNPIVLLKRCRNKSKFSNNKIKSKETTQSADSSNCTKGKSFRTNGLQIEPKAEPKTLHKIIKEQKKCEELIEQERRDFELAKKLQAQLNEIKSPHTPRKLRSYSNNGPSTSSNLSDLDYNNDDSLPSKRCRRTCGRTVVLNEAITNKKSSKASGESNLYNLRRSTRQIKPTRK